MGDMIKFTKGTKSTLPTLLLAEPGFTTDEKRLYVGGPSGNVPIPNKGDVDGINTYLLDTGVANAYIVSPVPALTAYTAGQILRFKATNANTGASTINVSGLGVKSLVKGGSTALTAGDIPAGIVVSGVYDGTQVQIIPDYLASIALKAPINNPTFTGSTLTTSGSIFASTSGAALELGSTSVAGGTPYIDFHSSGNNIDNDARIICNGGSTTVSQGTLAVFGGAFQFNNYNILRAINGGHATQSGQNNIVTTGAGVGASLSITFGTSFPSGCMAVLVSSLGHSVGDSGYINIQSTGASKTGFTLSACSYAAQTIAVQWLAFGY